MSNELFDKKMKERLGDINKPINANVWSNIKKQLIIPWYYSFWRRYALPSYAVLTTVLLLFTLNSFLINKEQINLLNDKITTIGQTNNQLHPQKTVIIKDTVYIQKTVYISTKHKEKDVFSKINKESLKNIGIDDRLDNTLNSAKLITNSQEITNLNTPTLLNDSSAITQTNKKEILGEQSKETISIAKKDTIKTLDALKPSPSIESVIPTSEKKTFSLPKVDTRFGISSAVSLVGDVNLGPFVEFMLKPNLGFSLGLAINRYPKIEFSSPKQFNFYTGKNFIDLYRPKIPEKYDALTEININTSILEFPLYLNYYVPLKQNLDLKFTFGTHIDMKLYQNIRFETYSNGEEIYTEFNTLASKNTWHNMILGVGFQYKFKNVFFQLNPTYLYNYREVDYVKSGGAFRLTGNVLVNFGSRR